MIKFVLANISDFESMDIDITESRKSVDNVQALKHIEKLSAEEMEKIRFESCFEFIGDNIYELMESDVWKNEESETE